MALVEAGTSQPLIRIKTKVRPLQSRDGAEALTAVVTVDSVAIEREIRAGIRGEVRFDDGDRAMYASDAGNYRVVPIGVVLPRDTGDVLHTLAVCRRFGAPIVARGGGTGIPGQTVNAAVVLDFSKYMNRILAISPDPAYAEVEPGTVLNELRKAAAPFNLTFGPDPATHSRNTLGGMIGNNPAAFIP